MTNYRSALSIIEYMQEKADKFNMGIEIIPTKDVWGEHSYNQTLNRLTDFIVQQLGILIICRLIGPLLVLYSFMLSRGYNVHLNGMSNVLSSLTKCLSTTFKACKTVSMLSSRMADFDFNGTSQLLRDRIECLKGCTTDWLAIPASDRIGADSHESMAHFKEFIASRFTAPCGEGDSDETDDEGSAGEVQACSTAEHTAKKPRKKKKQKKNKPIRLMSIHASKGLEEDVVIEMQPELCPLQQRIESDVEWIVYEEMCTDFIKASRGTSMTPQTVDRNCCHVICSVRSWAARLIMLHLIHLKFVTPTTIATNLFPEEDIPDQYSSQPSAAPDGMSLAEALTVLNLAEVPASSREAYLAIRARIKEGQSTNDPAFPSNAEISEAKAVLKEHMSPS